MNRWLYRWLLAVGIGHIVLGVVLAFAAHFSITDDYFQQLYASTGSADLPSAAYDSLLRTMVGLFGPTVASWGVLLCVLVSLYYRHGHAVIKPALFVALLVWCVLDSSISLYFGLTMHAYLNSAAALSIAIPLLLLKPSSRPEEPIIQLRSLADRRLRILITGGSGFIGTPLANALSQQGHDVLLLTRNIGNLSGIRTRVICLTDLQQVTDDERIDAIINLAGEPLAAARWTARRKQRFVQSRLDMTDALLQLVQRLNSKPEVLLNGSAVGFYGHWHDEELNESSPGRTCFSHELCAQWEQRATRMEALGVRVCLLRIGIVLGRDGGPLKELRRAFDKGVAAELGDGRQWMPWIHLHDVLDICALLIASPAISGAINLTAPAPVPHAAFVTALKRYIPRARFRVRVPAPAVRLLVGEMADEVLLSGQRVVPDKLLQHGYVFRHAALDTALEDLIRQD
ncbi:TIGR01777 family oxidoreductase [Pseudomonas sp.]|uniref:TIGR01777 family oxidoreductase n=1 Tax=Pseudomonas sp. TaxID=306 RepID=UPI003D0DB6C8